MGSTGNGSGCIFVHGAGSIHSLQHTDERRPRISGKLLAHETNKTGSKSIAGKSRKGGGEVWRVKVLKESQLK